MTALWLFAVVCASAAMYGAARSAENVVSLRAGRHRRLVWLIAMLYMSLLATAWLRPRTTPMGTASVEWVARAAVEPIALVPPGGRPVLTALIDLNTSSERLVATYVFGSTLLLGALLTAVYARHWHMRSRWEMTELQGTPVLISEYTGPALSGFIRPLVVVPRWVLELDASAQRAILLHETEHRRAGDHRLLAVATLLLVFNAWNPIMWLYCRRLLRAVEFDCDGCVFRLISITRFG